MNSVTKITSNFYTDLPPTPKTQPSSRVRGDSIGRVKGHDLLMVFLSIHGQQQKARLKEALIFLPFVPLICHAVGKNSS